MFGKKKEKKKYRGPGTAFVVILVIVLIAAVWALAGQNRTWEQVVTSMQRNVTVDQQLDYQCRDLESEAGQTKCEAALDEVAESLSEHRQALREAQ